MPRETLTSSPPPAPDAAGEDVAGPSLSVEAVLANAPQHDGSSIVVPAILDERD